MPTSSTGSVPVDEKGTDCGAQSASEGKQYEPLQTAAHRHERGLRRTESRNSSSSSPSMRRIRSNNGHGVADETDASNGPGGPDAIQKDPFEVVWDGEDDPLCPRSMSLLHKWALVVIVGVCSLCV